MKKSKSLLTMIIMFAGILIGIIILLTKPANEGKSFKISEVPMPEISIQKSKHAIVELMVVMKAKHRIFQLIRKDTITHQDSLEIKAIDQQLNQLLHD